MNEYGRKPLIDTWENFVSTLSPGANKTMSESLSLLGIKPRGYVFVLKPTLESSWPYDSMERFQTLIHKTCIEVSILLIKSYLALVS